MSQMFLKWLFVWPMIIGTKVTFGSANSMLPHLNLVYWVLKIRKYISTKYFQTMQTDKLIFRKVIYEFQFRYFKIGKLRNDFRSNVQGPLVLSFSPSFFNDLGPFCCVLGAWSWVGEGGGAHHGCSRSSSSQLFILMSLWSVWAKGKLSWTISPRSSLCAYRCSFGLLKPGKIMYQTSGNPPPILLMK